VADEPSRATRNLVADAYLCKLGCGRFAL